MLTPTEVVTRNVRTFLGDRHEVILAVRVEWGADAATVAKREGYLLGPHFLPVRVWRWIRSAVGKSRDDQDAGVGILALMADDGRILLSATPSRRKVPAGVVEWFPDHAALLPDLEMMETHLVPALTVGRFEFVVNSVDFKSLLEHVEAGTVRSPKLEAELGRLKAVLGRSQFS